MKTQPTVDHAMRARRRVRLSGQYLIAFLSFGVALYAIAIYGFTPLGSFVLPDMRANFIAHPLGIYAHAFGASIALLIGPLQFFRGMREKRPALHRWMGRIYLTVGVGIGGVAGLYMAFHAYGGGIARLGFATLAVVWLLTGFMAYRSIRRGEVNSHRRWMTRNYALTFAAVTLRIYLPIALISGFDFQTAYALIAWITWVPNLLFVQYTTGRT